ncbi:MAG: amidohydrolase family protein [Rhizorhabdus sp.]
MNIFDAQFHFGPGGVDAALAQINALGIQAVMIDEHWQGERHGHPAHKLANGVWRMSNPTAELAHRLHPTRFTSLLRVEGNDPEVEHVIRLSGQTCHIKAIRCCPGMDEGENTRFRDGGYDKVFRATRDTGLPLFVFAPLEFDALAEYARAYPDLQICIDHCGLFGNTMLRFIHWTGLKPSTFEEQSKNFDGVLKMAEIPNIGLKWAHADTVFGSPDGAYPGVTLRPILRRAIDAFGADRICWGSDASQNAEPWAETLFAMRENTDLSPEEFAWIMGDTLRKWSGFTGEEPVRECPIPLPTDH